MTLLSLLTPQVSMDTACAQGATPTLKAYGVSWIIGLFVIHAVYRCVPTIQRPTLKNTADASSATSSSRPLLHADSIKGLGMCGHTSAPRVVGCFVARVRLKRIVVAPLKPKDSHASAERPYVVARPLNNTSEPATTLAAQCALEYTHLLKSSLSIVMAE